MRLKISTTVLCLLFFFRSFAATIYYVSSSDPNGSDANAGTSQSAPWKTWQKVVTSVASFTAGTQVLFKRGDVFAATATLTLSASGNSGAYVIFGSYGTATAKPLINALKTVTGWTAESGRANVYSITGLAGTISPKVMMMDGAFQAWGRWPNADYNNYGGFLPYNSRNKDTIWDNSYGAIPNRPTDDWTGAKLVQRGYHFAINAPIIQSNKLSGGTMIFDWRLYDATAKKDLQAVNYNMSNATYCLMDHIATLDRQGEWCYNPTSDKISLYSTTAPSTHTIQIPAIDLIMNLNSKTYVTITDLAFTGANDKAITGGGGGYQDVKNCDFSYMGNYAMIFASGHHVIDNNTINWTMSMGLKISGGDDVITNNTFNNVLPIQGMNSGGQQGCPIQTIGSNVWIQYNKIYNCGGSAIVFDEGSNVFVQYNFIDKGMTQMDDVGIIYTVNQMYDVSRRNRRVTNNILVNCLNISSAVGLPNVWYNGAGIIENALYGDQYTNHTIWKDNIVADARMSVYFNDPFYDTLTGNIFYNFSSNAVANTHSKGNGVWLHNNKPPVGTYKIQGGVNDGDFIPTFTPYANQVNDNLFFSNYSGSSPAAAQKYDAGTHGDTTDARYVATADKNVYAYPLAQSNTNYFSATGSGGNSLTNWRSLGFDPNGTIYNLPVVSGSTSANVSRLIYNNNKTDSTVTLGGTKYIDAKTKKTYQGSVTLSPFTGMVLIANGAASLGKAPTVSITAPTNKSSYTQPVNVTISATAADADGKVVSVDFYNGSKKLGSDNTSPYSYSWNSVPAGNPIVITAIATDDSGLSTTSKTDTITVVAPNVAPKIAITSPLNAAKFVAPATISIAATATDSDGSVVAVRFYNKTTLLGTDSTSPYTYSWTKVAAGSYSLVAIATDNQGATTTSDTVNISVRDLVAPDVSLTSPPNDTTYISPASIAISATAKDIDGTITKVEFYRNDTLVASDATSPYSFVMTNIPAGSYTIMAKAYDNDGLTSTSSVATFVSAPAKKRPVIKLTSPATGASYTDPAQINIAATATDSDGTIVRVEFYANGVLIGADYASPYTLTYSSVPGGRDTIYARAIDNDSLTAISASSIVTVVHVNVAPTINITSPPDGDSTFFGSNFNFTATASDADGTITKVEFYDNNALVTTLSLSPYLPYSISMNLPLGTHTLTAKAYDNSGATASKSITFKVVPEKHVIIQGFKAIIR